MTSRKEIREAKEKLKIKKVLLTIFLSISAIFFCLTVSWWNTVRGIPEKKVYFYENFNTNLDKWDSLDSQLLYYNNGNASEKYVELSSKKYMAPHLKHEIIDKETPPDSFVFKFKVRVSNFTNEALTLGTLYFPTQPVSILVNQDGYIGIAHDMFTTPIFSNKSSGKIKKDEWQDIYVKVDGRKQTLNVYLNSSGILTKEYKDITYPLQQIWLGTIWIKGSGNYGAPLDVSFDDATIGNEGILYRPTLIQYIINFSSILF